jgi:ABC-type transport system involved in multi-copper enzyme maturation permease subunit
MTALRAIFLVTCKQLLGRKRFFGFALLSLLPALILYIGMRSGEVGSLVEIFSTLLVFPFFAVLLPVMSLVVAGAAFGDERGDGTLGFLTLRPIPRTGIAAAKVAAAAFASSILGIVGGVGLVGVYASLGGSFGVLPDVLVGAVIACVAYSAVFTLLGFLASKSLLIGIVYVFFIENGLLNLLPRLSPLSLWRVGFRATAHMLPEGLGRTRDALSFLGGLEPALGPPLVKAGVILLLSIGILAWLLKSRDAA